MSQDFALSQELAAIEDRMLSLAKDPVWFARQRVLRWQERADALERMAEKAKRKPSGEFRAALVSEALGGVDHSRAKTEKHDMRPFVEESEQNHRPTPDYPPPIEPVTRGSKDFR
jgi:hypothetical protein